MDSRFDGTAARQLVLVEDVEDGDIPLVRRQEPPRPRPRPRAVVQDVYREIDLRRRRAQIAARRLLRATAD